jgi:hypothetical protein
MTMGFLFALFIGFGLIATSIILVILWVGTKRRLFGIILGVVWSFFFAFIGLVAILYMIREARELKQEDIYGEYVIDRSKYPGKEADWQYDHFRFIITHQDSIYFCITDQKRVIKTYVGKVDFHPSYKIPRVILSFPEPRYHVVDSNPTLFRQSGSFYYVFDSPLYHNMFFKKAAWTPIVP